MCWPKRGQNWKDKKNKTNSRVDKLQFGFVGKKDQYWKDEEKRTNIEKMKERANIEKMKERANIEKMKERRRKKFPQRQIASKRSTPGLFQCQRVVPTCVVRPFYKSRYFCRNICLHFLNLKSDGAGSQQALALTLAWYVFDLIGVYLDMCLKDICLARWTRREQKPHNTVSFVSAFHWKGKENRNGKQRNSLELSVTWVM